MKKKTNVKAHTRRLKDGKVVPVRNHLREVDSVDLPYEKKEGIEDGKAENLFEEEDEEEKQKEKEIEKNVDKNDETLDEINANID